MLPRKFIFLKSLFILVLLASIVFAQKTKPSWIEQRPVDAEYYIGIGYASKVKNPTDYQKLARDNALSDIASQIKVQISSSVIQQVVEKAGMLAEDFKSYVRSSTKAELEGYELVDSWENNEDYWVYYRLSKAKFAQLRSTRLKKAKTLALDMFKRARANEASKNFDKALLFYFQAIPPIEKYVNEPLEVDMGGQRVYLFNEIYSSLQRILSGIKMRTLKAEFKGKLGQPIAEPLKVKVTYVEGTISIPVKNIPIEFAFIRGSGDLMKHAFSDAQGIAKTQVLRINSSDNLQIIQAKINLNKLINQENPSLVLKGILSSLVAPSARFMIYVSGLTAYIESQERVLGKPVEIKQLEPALKNILGSKGFAFVDSPSKADYLIKIKAGARKGAEIYGLHSSFLNLSFSVIDLKSGMEIYKKGLDNIKGIDLNYEKAGIKALSNAAKEIDKKLIPDFLQKIHSEK